MFMKKTPQFEESIFSLSDNRLKSLNSNLLPFADAYKGLIVNNNHLEYLDDEYFASCRELSYLGLYNAFAPDTKFNLGFLESHSSTLQKLALTLPPDVPGDLSVFKSLSCLTWLRLESAARLDSNREYPKLTKQVFIESFSHMKELEHLSLSYFDIGSIDKEMFEHSTKPA